MTEVELSALLSDLADVSAKLNAESNAINNILEQFEQKLARLNVGLEVWLPGPIDESPTGRVTYQGHEGLKQSGLGSRWTFLGFAKDRSGQWRLHAQISTHLRGARDEYGEHTWEEIDAEDPIPLQQAPRSVRIAALEALPALLEAMKEAAKEALSKIEMAKRIVE